MIIRGEIRDYGKSPLHLCNFFLKIQNNAKIKILYEISDPGDRIS